MKKKMRGFGEAQLASTQPIFAQTDRAIQEIQDFLGSEALASCPSCSSQSVNLVRMPQGCTHHAARRCGNCDRFLSWEPRPENKQKQQQQQARIAALLESPDLSQWERVFLQELKGKRSFSPKQQAVLTRIETEVGGQA